MPTIVSLIEKRSDVSILFSVDDEEIQKDIQDILEPLDIDYKYIAQNFSYRDSTKIVNRNQSNLYFISLDIVIPPPKLI